MNWALIVTIVFYALALLHSCLGFFQKRQIFVSLALCMVGVGFLFHTVYLVGLGLERRHFPITDLPESLSFFAWSITLTFIAAHIRYRYNVLGAFVLPLVSLLMILSEVAWEENHAIPPLLRSRWLYFHVSVAFLAYAGFFLMFIAALLYLMQEKELKSKRFRFLYFRLPALQACDELMRNSLFVGFVMMSLTIVTGAFWAQQAWGRFWSWDPKETASLVTWSIYLLLVHYRLSGGWRARRAAYVSIAGFVSMIITFGVNAGLHAYL
ncbi:MAG: ResC/HemX-like cytochrome c biosis rane protein [Acidobacteria bacterium]|jgi:cytochrome c-type biogenesis protein CcsB|nr:ResC/HemX-like cytochrome c biosis rane protein [Acidobacteriota bacterium]